MKAYTTSVVVWLVITVIVGIAILAIAWYRGLMPFSKVTSEATCKAYIMNACQKANENGWQDLGVFKKIKGCEIYFPNLEDCLTGDSQSCKNLCANFS